MDIQKIKTDSMNIQINKNIIIIGILSIALILASALAIGFCVKAKRYNRNEYAYSHQGMRHMMPDGTMMNNGSMDMDNTMNGMMSGLQGKTGDAFDKAFLSEMIVHHQGAVDMANAVLATSKRPELIKLANDIISAQTKEIDMMKGWQTAWFK